CAVLAADRHGAQRVACTTRALGTVYVNTHSGRPDGVAIWMPPPPTTGEPAAESAVWHAMEQRFGPAAYRRFTEAYRHFERVHYRRAVGPHWVPSAAWRHPHRQRQGIGGVLLRLVLGRADRTGLPCYLEAFVSGNVPFYEQRGFRVVEAGVES